jgi:eukaryotic translation initiation factor 2C
VKIVLRANYLQLKTAFELGKQETPLFRYSVGAVGGEELTKANKRSLVQNIIKDPMFANMQVATDYASIIVTTKKLDLGPANRKRDTLELLGPAQATPQVAETPQAKEAKLRRTKQYEIQSTGQFSLSDLVRALQTDNPSSWYGSKADVVQMLNIIISKAPTETDHVFAIGHNKYYPMGHPSLMEAYDIGGGLLALRGYYSSVRTSSNRVLVNLNVASAAFYKSVPLMELISEFLGARDTRPPVGQDLSKAEAFVRMLRVKTNYLKASDASGKPQTVASFKSIFAFAARPRHGTARQVKFSWTDPKKPGADREINVFDYFKTQHGITLRHPDWPVLNVGSKTSPSYLPVELAVVVPGQPVRRLLSGAQTTGMINFAARPPRANAESIAGNPGNGLKVMGFNGPAQANVLNQFGFSVGTDLLTVNGRILSTPQVSYGSKNIQAKEGAWNLRDVKFPKPGSFGSWSCVVLNYSSDGRGRALLDSGNQIQGSPVLDINGLLAALEHHLRSYGVRMGTRRPTSEKTIPRPTEVNRAEIDSILDEVFLKASAAKIELLFIVLKEADKWLYSRIKYFGDVKHGKLSHKPKVQTPRLLLAPRRLECTLLAKSWCSSKFMNSC